MVARIDQASRLPPRLRFFETGGRLREQITADPSFLQRHGGVWVANAIPIRGARDGDFGVEGLRRAAPEAER